MPTPSSSRPRRDTDRRLEPGRIAEALARMGVGLGGQRSELFSHTRAGMELVGWWTALGHDHGTTDDAPIPESWFPWSLGNIRPRDHVFVRNAGPLLVRPEATLTVADLGMGSALHLPVHLDGALVGAACVYWADERDEWPADRFEQVRDLARDALAPFG